MRESNARTRLPALRRAVRAFFGGGVEGARGIAAIEFAILAPTLALMLICTADLSLGIYRKMRVQNAAQFGAEYAAAHGFNATSITNAVSTAGNVPGLSVTPAPVQFCGCASMTGVVSHDCSNPCDDGSALGTYVTVSTQGGYSTILPYPIIPNSFTFATQATVRIQ